MKWWTIYALIVIIGITVCWIDYFDKKDIGNQMVDCFDDHGNEIIGLECIEEPPTIFEYIVVSFIGIIGLTALIWMEDHDK